MRAVSVFTKRQPHEPLRMPDVVGMSTAGGVLTVTCLDGSELRVPLHEVELVSTAPWERKRVQRLIDGRLVPRRAEDISAKQRRMDGWHSAT